MYIYGVYTVFLAGKLLNIWSYTVYIYGFGKPYLLGLLVMTLQHLHLVIGRRSFAPTHTVDVFPNDVTKLNNDDTPNAPLTS